MGRDTVRLRRIEARRSGTRRGAHCLVPPASCRLQMPPLRGFPRAAEDIYRQDPKIQAARGGEDGVNAPPSASQSSQEAYSLPGRRNKRRFTGGKASMTRNAARDRVRRSSFWLTICSIARREPHTAENP